MKYYIIIMFFVFLNSVKAWGGGGKQYLIFL